MTINYGTVCSGIAADAVAWRELGWRCVFVSEIAEFPSAVLKHRYPEVPNLGDFTQIGADAAAGIDLLFGGTPCQDFSVAGLRAGLAGDRGNLSLEFLRFAQRARPRWVVWENVFGVLSVDGGRAFGAFLGGLAELGYGWAYRILDAQHAGVPQRRRRVFVVGYLGDWRRAAAVLFERHSLSGDPPPSRAPRSEIAGPLGAGTPGSGWRDDHERAGAFVANALTSSDGGADVMRTQGNQYVPHEVSAYSGTQEVEAAAPLLARATGYRSDLETETFIASCPPVTPIQSANQFQNGAGIGEPGDPMYTLDTRGDHAIAFDVAQITHPENRVNPKPGDPAPPLAATGRTHVAFSSKDYGQDVGEEVSPTLRASGFTNSHANGGKPPAVACFSIVPEGGQGADLMASQVDIAPAITTEEAKKIDRGVRVANHASVRRLMPVECERLQAFPDDYTLIPNYKGKWAKDGPRYEALGNTIATVVLKWIGERIRAVEDLTQTKERP